MSEYCLRWNNHQPNLVTVFSELLNAEALVDVTLATDGHFIHAHKLVLSACSVYFKDLFGSNPCKHPIVFLKDIKIEDLKTVIDFIYRGEVNVSQERLQDVLKTAESLRIKGLADKPFSYDEYPSQSRSGGQHLSSSFSSQRSSLTDSREQTQSIEGEDGAEGSGNSPPATKKRKVVSSQDSGEFGRDTNHEGEDRQRGDGKDDSQKKSSTVVNDEGANKSSSKDKVKEEKEGANANSGEGRPEYPETRAADAMLLLQGSSSEGGADEGNATPITSANSRADSNASGLMSPQSQSLPGRPTNATILSRLPGSRVHYVHERTGGPKIHRSYDKGSPRVHATLEKGSVPRVYMTHEKASSSGGGTGVGSSSSSGGGSSGITSPTPGSGKKVLDPYMYANCLVVRPKLKASDGSYVTIRTGTAENFLRAVEDVRHGKMGFCKAGKIYGVNHATLQKFYKAMGYSVRNRSNNPNFLKSPPSSEREENEGGDSSHEQQLDVDSFQYPSYPSPTAFYQHFLTPHTDLTTTIRPSTSSSFDFQRVEAGTSIVSSKSVTPSSTSASIRIPQNKGSPPSLDTLSGPTAGRFDPYSAGRLLNYSSFYGEAINMEEAAAENCRTSASTSGARVSSGTAIPTHHVPHPPPVSSTTHQDGHQTEHGMDVNHPIVLCNL